MEWFCTIAGKTQALHRNELEIRISHNRLVLNSWTETGSRVWKIYSWEQTGDKLILFGSRRMGAERLVIELVPRASAQSIALAVKSARQARCEILARTVCSLENATRVERVALSPGARRGQPGRYARIVLGQRCKRIAVTGPIASPKAADADAFLAAALLWFKRTSARARPPYIEQLWLVVERAMVKAVAQRVALLRPALQEVINVFEVDQQLTTITPVAVPTRQELWKRRLSRFPPTFEPQLSTTAARLIALAPNAIDVVHAKRGETLRFLGLPFARIRQVMGRERVWFGVEGSRRRLLEETSEQELIELLSELLEHRSADSSDLHNALYRNASEAWLESLLRRDITRLDPGLIIAPLYAQFRIARGGATGVRPIDLLALRTDGRLAVIELKVFEAREHVLQAADYWQRVEAHRRRGHITRARLFGDREIRNQSPLIYLVAPTLRVHPSLNALARSIAPDIEIYRFDISEDWRRGVRVMRRQRLN